MKYGAVVGLVFALGAAGSAVAAPSHRARGGSVPLGNAALSPDLGSSTKAVIDVTSGTNEVSAGDILEYTITVTNTGTDSAIDAVLTDPLPVGVTYVPGSLAITTGPNSGAKSDAAGDDQGHYDGATRSVVFHLGTGASGAAGGELAVNAATTVRFRVQIDPGTSGTLENQATIRAAGLAGSAAVDYPTDGNGSAAGAPPTTTIILSACPIASCACLTDVDCGGAASGQVCDNGAGGTFACTPGCRGQGGNGCPSTALCTSMDATIGACVGCTDDAGCGGAASGKVCEATTYTCIDGCRGTGGNGCPTSEICTSNDGNIGACVGCVADGDCGGPTSGKVCDASAQQCVDGCRGMGGNGCAPGVACTSTDGSIGACVTCAADADCGGPESGKVCEASTQICVDGCRGQGGNGCPSSAVCTSMDGAVGACVDCIGDGDCGGPESGKICDDGTETCVDGCRGMGGNGCPADEICTSTSTTKGACVGCLGDGDCGGPESGKVCNDATETCVDGCRGEGGNGCPSGEVCSSDNTLVGECVECAADADCGGPTSGKVCDATKRTCGEGCRGQGGNGCPEGQTCSSIDGDAGTCSITGDGGAGGSGAGGAADVVVAAGGGICAARPGPSGVGGAWLLALAVALGARRRRR